MTRRELLCKFGELGAPIGAFLYVWYLQGQGKKEALARAYQEVQPYYPEMVNFPLYDFGKFRTPNRHVSWFNFSPQYNFDPQAASQLYRFFEKVARSEIVNVGTDMETQTEFRFWVTPRPTQNDLKLFIVDLSAPHPEWGIPNAIAMTQTSNTGKPDLTVVKLAPNVDSIGQFVRRILETPQRAASVALAVEACQSSVMVNTEKASPHHVIQEMFCNGLGRVIGERQEGTSFQKYISTAGSYRRVASGSYYEEVFPGKAYQNIPRLPRVLQKK